MLHALQFVQRADVRQARHGELVVQLQHFALRGRSLGQPFVESLHVVGSVRSANNIADAIRQSSGASVGPAVDAAKVGRILGNLERRGVQVVRGERAASVLDDIGAAAAYHPMFGKPRLFFRDGDIPRGQLIEELLHHGQQVRRGFAQPANSIDAKRIMLLDEIEAQQYMIGHAVRKNWTQAEVGFYQSQLRRWEDMYRAFQLEHAP